jgi:hypothetical protein
MRLIQVITLQSPTDIETMTDVIRLQHALLAVMASLQDTEVRLHELTHLRRHIQVHDVTMISIRRLAMIIHSEKGKYLK